MTERKNASTNVIGVYETKEEAEAAKIIAAATAKALGLKSPRIIVKGMSPDMKKYAKIYGGIKSLPKSASQRRVLEAEMRRDMNGNVPLDVAGSFKLYAYPPLHR